MRESDLKMFGNVGDNGYIKVGLSLLDIGDILDTILFYGWDILSTSIPIFRISWIWDKLYKPIVCECNKKYYSSVLVYNVSYHIFLYVIRAGLGLAPSWEGQVGWAKYKNSMS